MLKKPIIISIFLGQLLFSTSGHGQNPDLGDNIEKAVSAAYQEVMRHPLNAKQIIEDILTEFPNDQASDQRFLAIAIQAQAQTRLGTTSQAHENIQAAITLAKQSQDIQPDTLAELYFALGAAQEAQGDLADAFMSFQHAYDIWSEANKIEKKQAMAISMGGLYIKSGDTDRAISFLDALVPAVLASKDELNKVRILNNLAYAYIQKGEAVPAQRLLQRALQFEFIKSSPFLTAHLYQNMGEALVTSEQWEDAQTYLSNALGLAKELQIDGLVILGRTHLGQIALRRGDFNVALDHAHSAASLSERIDETPLLRDSYLLLSTIFRAMENFEASLAYMDKYIETKNQVTNNEAKRRFELLEAQFRLSEKESEIKLLQKQNEINALKLNQAQTYRNAAISVFALLLGVIMILGILLRSKALINRRLKQNADELMKAQQQLEKANQIKSDILAMTSHEIRTPLNAIMGMSQVLMRSDLETDLHRLAETIHSSGELLIATLNDILDLSKIEAGRLDINQAPFFASDLAEQVDKLWRHKAEEKGLKFEIDDNAAPQDELIGDLNRIQQIIFNLVSNAIKFTNQGTVKISIYNENFADGKPALGVQVIDSGIGIPNSLHERVFEPFHQVETGSARSFGGTGLGLAICRQLTELMDGKITLASRPNQGTVFTLLLPLKKAHKEPSSASANQVFTPDLETAATINILVAEDNELNQMVIRHMLSVIDTQISFASNGQEALNMHIEKDFDLILMDLHMPVMDGASATKAIRALENEKGQVPIIALTADAMEGDRQKVLDVGMDDYVSKPIDLEKLVIAIQTQIKNGNSSIGKSKQLQHAS